MAKRGSASKPSARKGAKAQSSAIEEAPELDESALPDASETNAAPQPGRAPTAGRAAAKKGASITITDIGDHLAATFDMPKSHAKIYLIEAVALITKQLKKGAKVRLNGLGVFQVKKRPARKARNPNTGEEVKVKAGKRLTFTAARDLKAKL